MDPQIRIFANRFILNLSAAVERSGLSVLRPAFPEADAQLIRSAYESRAREQPADDTLEIECSSPLQRTREDNDDGSKFLAEYTTFAWDTSSCEDEADSTVTQSDSSSPATPKPSLPPDPSPAVPYSSDLPSLFNTESEELPPLPLRQPSPLRRKPGRKAGQLDYLESFVRSIPSKGHTRPYYQCVICMHTAERKHDVKRHAASHDCVPDPYTCYGCNKHFKRTEGRSRHWQVHPDCKVADEKISAELNNYNTRHGRRRKFTAFSIGE